MSDRRTVTVDAADLRSALYLAACVARRSDEEQLALLALARDLGRGGRHLARRLQRSRVLDAGDSVVMVEGLRL